MNRTRSFVEGQDNMGASSVALPPLPQTHRGGASMALICLPQTSLSLTSSEVPYPDAHRATAAPEQARESPSESASSRETWPTEQTGGPHGKESHPAQELKKDVQFSREDMERPEQTVVQRVGSADRLRLKDIVCEPIDSVARRMSEQPDELSEDLKAELREILNGTGGIQQREDFALLQKWLISRRDLFPEMLMRANRMQLEILVAIKTGIQAFLHPDISVTQSVLIEVFFCKRCRNMACQNQLPGDECACEVCSTKIGFCNVCMCTICSKFDFDVNTCRWIGCDFCAHWTHTDCAIRVGQIAKGVSLKGPGATSEMLFKCRACKHTSELLGWVKDVFRTCAGDWDKGELMKEFDSVRRIFHGSEDSKGRRLFWKSEELLDRLKNGADDSTVCKDMQYFFQELEAEEAKEYESGTAQIIEPQEACSRIAEVVQEAIAKMDTVTEEKAQALKKARLSLETCDKELEEKKRELQELQSERQRKRREIEELETIVRLKLAEADMFQMRADEARREAEDLQRIVVVKSEKVEEEYTTRYLKLRLNEVEAERRALFEKIQLQEHSRLQPDASQMLMMCKIQELLKRVYNKNEPLDENEASAPKL